jgi:eukaryotic-like serine/threonine-protein kinase
LYEFGPFRVELRDRLLMRNGEPIAVTPKAFDTLMVLIQNCGHLVLKDDLMKAVWPDSFVEEVNLSQNVSMLRKALGDTAHGSRYIVTVSGSGYRFAAQVREVVEEGEPEALVVESHAHSQVVIEESKSGRGLALAGITILVLLAALVGYRLHIHPQHKTVAPPPPVAVTPRRSIAVLGFQNLSGRPDAAWLSTALSEMFTTELAAGEQLRTVSSEDVAQMKVNLSLPNANMLANSTLTRIRENLGADLVVLGSYSDLGRASGGQIRLDLRLQDAAAGETVASISETGRETDLFELVSRAGERLRHKLGVEDVSPAEAVNVQASLPANPEAARFYAEGLAKLRVFDALTARDLLREAVRGDPTYPLTHSALADAWSALGYDQKALEETKKAFQLSGKLSREDRLFVEGIYREAAKEWGSAAEIYGNLFAYSPDNLDYGLRLAAAQTAGGKAKGALVTVAALRKLPAPLHDDPRLDLAEAKADESLGDYGQSGAANARAAEKGKALGARLLVARAFDAQAWVLQQTGQAEPSIAAAREAKGIYMVAGDLSGVGQTLRTIGVDLEYQGDYPGALRTYDEAIPILRKIGNRQGLARVVNDEGVLFMHQGNFPEARKRWAEALRMYTEISDPRGMAAVLGNTADTFTLEGDLASARSNYDRVLPIFDEVGDKYGYALTIGNIGEVLAAQGHLTDAQKRYEQAVSIFKRIDDKSDTALYLFDIGDVYRSQGNFADARKAYTESLSLRKEIGEKGMAAESQVGLADLSVDEGHATDALAALGEAQQELKKENRRDDQIWADVVYARSLLAQGKPRDAWEQIRDAETVLPKSVAILSRLEFATTAARVETAFGNTSEARYRLNRCLAEARKHGFVRYQFEARLALGEIEMKSRNADAGRQRLVTLEKDAKAAGFVLMARKAAAARANL